MKEVTTKARAVQAAFRRIQELMEWRNLEMRESRRCSFPQTSVEKTKRDLSAAVGEFFLRSVMLEMQLQSASIKTKIVGIRWLNKLRNAIRMQLYVRGYDCD